MISDKGTVNHLLGIRTILMNPLLPTNGDELPKVKKPKKGWFRPQKKRPRRGPVVPPSERGLPPCPACGEWSMQKDGTRKEIYCGSCGAIV